VDVEGVVAEDLVELVDGLGGVLVVLTENGLGFGAEVLYGLVEVEEAVGFHFEDALEVLASEGGVVDGLVVVGEGVRGGAGLLEHGFVAGGREFRGAPEHHVLEEMGKAGAAFLDFIARTGADDDKQ
jgi:hypothetical protein